MHMALVYAVLATVSLLLQLVQLDKRSLQGYMRHHWYARTKLSNASMCTRTHALGTRSHTNLRGHTCTETDVKNPPLRPLAALTYCFENA
jgi:hypothetical protein